MMMMMVMMKLGGFGRNLAGGWELGKEWLCKIFCEIVSGTPEKGAEISVRLFTFFSEAEHFFVINTKHGFGHFHFTNFHVMNT